MEIFQLLCFHITIGNPDPDCRKLLLLRIKISIAARLCQMNLLYFLNPVDFPICPFNLIYGHHIPVAFRRINNPICSPINQNPVVLCLIKILQRNLRMIIRPHSPLDHAVNSASLLHGIFRCHSLSIVNISGS